MSADADDAELVREAARYVIGTRITTISALQGRFHIANPKARELMQALENHGIVGTPAEGTRTRPLLVARRDLEQVLASLPGGEQ